MKPSKIKKRSLIVSCVWYFTFFTLLVVLLYTGFHYLVNRRISEAFFTLEDLLQYEDELIQEDYAKIPLKNGKTSAFIIFDEKGKTVYASSQTIGEKVFYQDMELIGDYYAGRLFDVFEETDTDGTVTYRVYLSDYWNDNIMPEIKDYCILDEDYHILEGTLFPERAALTEREFDLLCGISKNNGTLEKYIYENADGEERTLAFLSFSLSEKAYNRMIQEANSLWAIGIPAILLAILIFAFLFSRRVKQCIAPLNKTILSYEKGKENQIDPQVVPSEFYDMVCNFKELVSQLEHTQKEKETLYEEKQRLIADISHDLKTPLTVIQGYAEALTQQRVPEEKKERYLQTMVSKSRLATEMVNDLFLFTQMEHPDFPMHREMVDFTEFVKGFFAEKYTEIMEAGFSLNADLPDTPVKSDIDKRLMRRVLENLLNNALKHNPKGTTVFVTMQTAGQRIQLLLADDGVGIPPNMAHTLFQPFVTSNQARTTGKGTGLGLSIAHRITEMHGGKIELVSPPHKPYRTEFRILLTKAE